MDALIRREPRPGLRLHDFVRDEATGVHVAPGAPAPFGYLDGAEQRLLDLLGGVADRGSGSDELRPHMTDWATGYHLTPYRGTLLDCLGLEAAAGARVLELGAGCGAVTRWMGERFGSVDAVEGAGSRARVARARCADLDAVRVFTANYSELAGEGDHDLVTLIGVLEYSHLYHPVHREDPEAAAVANLRVARSALADDGLLVLAIENRLGLKYLNAAREDHSGRLFEGIEGYVHRDTPVTWSARALEGMLAEAGFATARFLLPFPDYKLARTIVNVDACSDEDAVHAWLAGPAPGRGSERPDLLFNETLAVREVARAGLLRDLANSFLVLAYAGDPGRTDDRLGIDLGWAVRHYSLDRRAGLRKRATLRGDVVEHEPAPFGDADRSDVREAVAAAGLVHSPATEPHHRGELLLTAVLECAAREGLGDAFAAHVREHRAWLLDVYGIAGEGDLVDGAAIDAGWWNVVLEPGTGARRVIDTEWALVHPVPVDYVVWRTVYHFLLRHHPELPRPLREQPVGGLLAAALHRGGVHLGDEEVRSYVALEGAFAAAVSPGPVPATLLPALLSAASLHAMPRAGTIVAAVDEVVERPELLRAYASCVSADDPVTLVVYAPDRDAAEVGPAVERALAAAGLAEDGPDVLLLAVARDGDTEARLASEAVAVLTDREPAGPFAGVPRLDARAAEVLRDAAHRAAEPAGPALPEPVAAFAQEVAGRHGHARLVAVAAGAPRGRARTGWRTCDPRTVSPATLVADFTGTVVVCAVDARRLRSDDCLRTVLQVAADCADALVVAVRDGRLREALRVLGVDAAAEDAVDGHRVAVVAR